MTEPLGEELCQEHSKLLRCFQRNSVSFYSKLPYEWSDDPLTLDFSVFPAFEKQLLDAIGQGASFGFEVRKGEYTVTLTSDDFKKALLSQFKTDLNQAFLETCLDQCRKRLVEAMPDQDPSELEAKALPEGLREYNLSFRKKALETLVDLQDKKIKVLQAELGITHVPISSFNPQREVQRLFDELQKIASKTPHGGEYISSVTTFIEEQLFDLVIFDLHAMLRRYLQLIGTQSIYVFFHEFLST